jgi:hypothetical protein
MMTLVVLALWSVTLSPSSASPELEEKKNKLKNGTIAQG